VLELYIQPMELYNEELGEFVSTRAQTLQLEHSLISLSKWEAKWKKPFMSQDMTTITNEEVLDYIRCMTISSNVDPMTYYSIGSDRKMIEQIKDYIQDPHTATTIKQKPGRGRSREIITSELIYYWMVELGIPFECQKWHLGRLLTLIEVCSIKQTPEKKMSKAETFSQNKSLNALRRAKMGSRG